MTIVGLVCGNTLVHRILWQKYQVLIRILTIKEPIHLKIWHQLLIAFFCLVIVSECFKTLRLAIDIRLSWHSCDALDDILFFVSEYEDNIFHSHKCMGKLGLSHFWSAPAAVHLGFPEMLWRNWIYDEVPGSPFKKILGTLNYLLNLILVHFKIANRVWDYLEIRYFTTCLILILRKNRFEFLVIVK